MTHFSIRRQHEIHAGHRIYGHQGQCSHLHGHSYIFHFFCSNNTLDTLGMVIDFAVIKNTLCKWLDDNYDHRMLLWSEDPLAVKLQQLDSSVVIVPYNPTAENIAHYLLTDIGPQLLKDTSVILSKVIVEEGSKSSAICEV